MFPLYRDGGFDPLASASVSTAPRTIKDGDLVVFYETPMNMKAITVSAKGQHQNRYGAFPHKVWGGNLGVLDREDGEGRNPQPQGAAV